MNEHFEEELKDIKAELYTFLCLLITLFWNTWVRMTAIKTQHFVSIIQNTLIRSKLTESTRLDPRVFLYIQYYNVHSP